MHPLGAFRHNLAGLAILTVLVLGFLGGGLTLLIGGTHVAQSADRLTATTPGTITTEAGDCAWHYRYEVHEKGRAGTLHGATRSDPTDEDETICAESHDEGELVTVHYDPDRPADHSLSDAGHHHAMARWMMASSVPLLAIGIWLLYKGVQQGRGRS